MVGYYPKLSQLVSGLMHHDILTGSAKSFADLNAQVEQLSKRCSEALAHMAVKASGRFVPPSAFAAGTGKAFTGAYAWNAPREAVGRERPLTRDEMRQVQGVLSTINRLPYFCARCLLHAMTTSGAIKPGARVLFPHIHFSASFMAAH